MSTQIVDPRLDEKRLQDRIETFYVLFNEKKWDKCFDYIDPKLRDEGKVVPEIYIGSLSSFFAKFGPLENLSVDDLKLFVDVKDNKYDDRDFAYGMVAWTDRQHQVHSGQERWVKAADGRWYSRVVGFV